MRLYSRRRSSTYIDAYERVGARQAYEAYAAAPFNEYLVLQRQVYEYAFLLIFPVVAVRPPTGEKNKDTAVLAR